MDSGDGLPLVEPVPIEDELVTGVARIEDVAGFCARFVLYSEQTCYEAGGQKIWVIKKKIVMPYTGVRPCHEMVAGHLARVDGRPRLIRR